MGEYEPGESENSSQTTPDASGAKPPTDLTLGPTEDASAASPPIDKSNAAEIEPENKKDQPSTLLATGRANRDSPATPVTDFYDKHCVKILVGLSLADILIAVILFVSSPQTAIRNAVVLTVVMFTPLVALFYLVEDKNKIALSKRVATLVVVSALPLMQFCLGLAQTVQYNRTIELQDIPRLRSVYNVVMANDYMPYKSSKPQLEDALPKLKSLAAKYPYHPQVLLTLGLAQFDLKDYQNAVETFGTLVKVSPNDALSHYYLGISLKKHSDELEIHDLNVAGKLFSYCGSPTIPWNSVPPSEEVRQTRIQALGELSESMAYYYESPVGGEQKLGLKIARNIGWLNYQLSNECSDRRMCEDAIDWHLKALGQNHPSNFSGDPKYVLALDNLGEIYRAMGNPTRSYMYLREAIRVHQELLKQDPVKAKNRDYRCVYQTLSDYYKHDHRDADASKVEQLGKGLF